MAVFTLRQRYYCPLPPTALVRRLQHLVEPRPTGWLWHLGLSQPTCWGEVLPATRTFTARMPRSRSSGPSIRGQWQIVPEPLASPLAGTVVQLTIRMPRDELFGSGLFACLFVSVVGWTISQNTPATQALAVPAIMGGFFVFLIALNARRSIRYAEQYFQQGLSLSKVAD